MADHPHTYAANRYVTVGPHYAERVCDRCQLTESQSAECPVALREALDELRAAHDTLLVETTGMNAAEWDAEAEAHAAWMRAENRGGGIVTCPDCGSRAFVDGTADIDLSPRRCRECEHRAVVAERDELRATLDNERGEGKPPSEGWVWCSRGYGIGEWEHESGAVACRVIGQRHNGRLFAEWRLAHVPDEIERGGYRTARSAMRAADAALTEPK